MTPLGRLAVAGYIHGKSGYLSWRALGRFALVYVLAGAGRYQDANGYSADVEAGDLLLLFPELAHRYGPGRRGTWDEFYLTFEGPAFDFWRGAGLLDAARPVAHLQPVGSWRDRLAALAAPPDGLTPGGQMAGISRLLATLAEIAAPHMGGNPPIERLPWLDGARRLLDSDLSRDVAAAEVAARLGLSYETFRKGFEQQVGVSPARYRAGKRMDAARALLLHTAMTGRQISDSLGFPDEFYFSKRFKQIVGVSPREFRRQSSATVTGLDDTVQSPD